LIFSLLFSVKTENYEAKVNWEGKTSNESAGKNDSRSSVVKQNYEHNVPNDDQNHSNNTVNHVWNQERWFALYSSDDQQNGNDQNDNVVNDGRGDRHSCS
jgi:hypothetical protein